MDHWNGFRQAKERGEEKRGRIFLGVYESLSYTVRTAPGKAGHWQCNGLLGAMLAAFPIEMLCF